MVFSVRFRSFGLQTPYPVVAAFDSGNLSKVAQDLHEKYPPKPIVIAGDDDHHLEVTKGRNPGQEKALAAA